MIVAKKVYIPVRDRPVKVAFFSNGPNLPTGYAKVIREITNRVSKDIRFEVSIINENWFGDAKESWNGMDMYALPVQMTPNGPNRSSTAHAFHKVCERIQPDMVIFLEDSFTMHDFGFEGLMKTPYKRVFYIPLDGEWIPETGVKVIRTMDRLVSMAKFTQDCLKKEGFDSDMIWHGVDLELFHPVSSSAQKELKKKYGFKEDEFVIFNYGRNSNIRKNNPGMLWILAKYLSQAPPNTKAYLHILDPEFPGNNLIDYLTRHLSLEFPPEVLQRIVFSNFRTERPASDKDVAEMIQMSDLVITASTGEGFGLIMAEGMACAKPVISTDYTTPHELLIDTSLGVGERGWTVPIESKFVAGLSTAHAYVNKEAFVDTIHLARNNPDEMRKRGFNGRKFAEEHLNWDYIAEQWKELILKWA
jgi:glycosyltransferase involved in cell wall biosynthesis